MAIQCWNPNPTERTENTHIHNNTLNASDTLSHINSLVDALTSHPAPHCGKDLLPRAERCWAIVSGHAPATDSLKSFTDGLSGRQYLGHTLLVAW